LFCSFDFFVIDYIAKIRNISVFPNILDKKVINNDILIS